MFACMPEIVVDTPTPDNQEEPINPDDNNDPEQGEEPDSGEDPNDPEQGEDPNDPEQGEDPNDPEQGEEPGGDDVIDNPDYPGADTSIEPWTGLWASDGAQDAVGSNVDIYHEANTFTNRVVVAYNGSSAEVTSSNPNILVHKTGAYVTIDMLTNDVSQVEIVLSGKSNDGALKIYGDKKFKLVLNGVDLTSQRGPAINSQVKKRMFLELGNGTTNRLTDCASYGDDSYTLAGSYNEDRKGALFAEGHIIVSGRGALVVAGKCKHAIVTDGYYYQRPGATIVVTEAAKNAIHVKGDSDDAIGVHIAGGAIVANVASTAGKGVKSDLDIVVEGGVFNITTSGNATYDSDEKDTSAAACLKSNGDTHIKAGVLNLSSSGSGGKGISTDAALVVDGGEINIATSGGQYKYSSSLTSSPKGVRADGNITINGGRMTISVTGRSEGSEGLESKDTLTVNGGELIVVSYDDAINAAKNIVMNGGKVYAQGTNNDGIDSNGSITVNGGLFIGIGASNPEGGIDVDSNTLYINGGYVIGVGGGMMGKPASSSKQYSVVYGGASMTAGQKIALLDASSNMLFSFESPISMSATLCMSTPDIKSGTTYTVASGGSVSNYSECWQGWYGDGSWSGGSTLTTFTPSSVVTQIGSTGGGPGGGGGGGGWPGGGWPR